MMRLTILFFSVLLFSCENKRQNIASEPPVENKKEIKIKVYTLEDSTSFGYDILANGKLYVHQPHIPAINSIKGFKSILEATKTARFVADKIEKGISPPSITIEELDSLGIQY